MKDKYEVSTILTAQYRSVQDGLTKVTRSFRALENQVKRTQATMRRESRITQFATGRPAGGAFTHTGMPVGGIGYNPYILGAAGTAAYNRRVPRRSPATGGSITEGMLTGGLLAKASPYLAVAYATYKVATYAKKTADEYAGTYLDIIRIAQTLGKSASYAGELKKQLYGAADASHIARKDLIQYADELINLNSDPKLLKSLPSAARLKYITKMDPRALAQLSAVGFGVMGVSTKNAAQFYSYLLASSRRGAFPLASSGQFIGPIMGALAPTYQGMYGVRQAMGLLQTAKEAQLTQEKTATGSLIFSQLLFQPDTEKKLKELGFSLRTETGAFKGTNLILLEMVRKMASDPTMETKLKKILTKEGMVPIIGARNLYRRGLYNERGINPAVYNAPATAAYLNNQAADMMKSSAGKYDAAVKDFEKAVQTFKAAFIEKTLPWFTNIIKGLGFILKPIDAGKKNKTENLIPYEDIEEKGKSIYDRIRRFQDKDSTIVEGLSRISPDAAAAYEELRLRLRQPELIDTERTKSLIELIDKYKTLITPGMFSPEYATALQEQIKLLNGIYSDMKSSKKIEDPLIQVIVNLTAEGKIVKTVIQNVNKNTKKGSTPKPRPSGDSSYDPFQEKYGDMF